MLKPVRSFSDLAGFAGFTTDLEGFKINWYLDIFFVILLENHSETQQIKWFQTHQTLIRQKVFLQLI